MTWEDGVKNVNDPLEALGMGRPGKLSKYMTSIGNVKKICLIAAFSLFHFIPQSIIETKFHYRIMHTIFDLILDNYSWLKLSNDYYYLSFNLQFNRT